jgi:glutamate dehydrogenase/leucine dehydrogenase
MESLLNAFKDKMPEIIFEWHDEETEAEGWVVINSLRNGAAGGGTRMRKGLNRHEVESLAKVMEIKFTVSGPPIGGAKSGINFDPSDPRKNEVLKRWYKVVTPLLKNYYGTGGDLNVDEIKDVIPITEKYGLWHPQEGIVNGYLKPVESQKIHIIGQLRQGVSKKLEDPKFAPSIERGYTIADFITGFGVAEAVRHYYDIFKNETLEGKRAIIQGWGNVSGGAGFYLAQNGVKIVGIIDRAAGLIDTGGLSFEEVKELVLQREGNQLKSEKAIPYSRADLEIWDIPADIFVPGAASRLVSREHLERMLAGGLEVISAGANVPYADSDLFYGPTAEFADQHCAVVPDFIANCGMARVFAYLMQVDAEISDQAIFEDVSKTIRRGLSEVYELDPTKRLLTKKALEIALKKLS